MSTWHPAPFGLSDLENDAAKRYKANAAGSLTCGDTVRCCVRGCDAWLLRRRRGDKPEYCRVHGVSISTSPTYVYHDYKRNFIVGHDLLDSIKKVESWRLGNERSEDALSWNVFIGLSQLGALDQVFEYISGFPTAAQPELYLWGNRISAGSCNVWEPLRKVRGELEPGMAIPTEPDIVLRVPGKAIVLIEAKFGSPNGTLKNKEARFGSVRAFLDRYRCRPGCSDPLHREAICQQEPHTVLEQLCRNVIFAQWLAEPGEKPLVVNLVPQDKEESIIESFSQHLAANSDVGFRRATWEGIASIPVMSSSVARPLREYLANKTINLRKAFAI